MLNGRSGTSDDGVDSVVVEMLTGCGAEASNMVDVVVVVNVADVADVADAADAADVADVAAGVAATRIQHRTPRLRPRAPSTPAELVIPGFVMI